MLAEILSQHCMINCLALRCSTIIQPSLMHKYISLTGMDFNNAPVEVTFNEGVATFMDAQIPVVDDPIDEPPTEGFVVILEVISEVDLGEVVLSPRNISLCIIDDDDSEGVCGCVGVWVWVWGVYQLVCD